MVNIALIITRDLKNRQNLSSARYLKLTWLYPADRVHKSRMHVLFYWNSLGMLHVRRTHLKLNLTVNLIHNPRRLFPEHLANCLNSKGVYCPHRRCFLSLGKSRKCRSPFVKEIWSFSYFSAEKCWQINKAQWNVIGEDGFFSLPLHFRVLSKTTGEMVLSGH